MQTRSGDFHQSPVLANGALRIYDDLGEALDEYRCGGATVQ
jgi:hypothetical protein